MKDDILSRAVRVVDPRAAAAFTNPLRRRLLLLAAGRECSLVEFAAALDCDLKRLHYHASELKKLGLLVVARTRPRAGRGIKMYRAKAKAFFVPDHVMPSQRENPLAVELRNALAKTRRPRDGTLYFLGEQGEPQMRAVENLSVEAPPSSEHWRVLQMSHAQALRLMAEIADCLKSHGRAGSARAQPYLVHFALAPRPSR